MTGGNSDDATTAGTRASVLALHEAFNRHDAAGIMALMTADCVFENTSPAPDGERHVGHAAVGAFWDAFFLAAPAARFDLEELIAAGDRAVLRWTYHWLEPDGQPGHIRGVDIFRLRDGLIAEKLSYVKG
jgi:ketosteroid isomerase-like protein